jgi:alpha-ribazole phosphatase
VPDRFILVRHAPPLIEPGLCYGRLDIEAEPLLLALPRARIWTSPSRRCLALARVIAARHRLRPHSDHRLLELDFGAWEGFAWSDAPRPRLDTWAHAPLGRGAPGGESGAGLIARVRSFAATLRASPGRHIVVSHGGPLVVLAALLAGRRPDLLAPRLGYGQVLAIFPFVRAEGGTLPQNPPSGSRPSDSVTEGPNSIGSAAWAQARTKSRSVMAACVTTSGGNRQRIGQRATGRSREQDVR